MGSVMNKPGSDGYDLYPYEFTPLYSGTPSAFPRSNPPLGGGYVEPAALHATPGLLQDGIGNGVTGVSHQNLKSSLWVNPACAWPCDQRQYCYGLINFAYNQL